MDPKPEEIVRELSAGRNVSDHAFDALYPARLRRLSENWFTPVRIAMRAVEWLVGSESPRVLDIGAGAGKLCLVGAACSRAHFTGIEHRADLVEAGKAAQRALGLSVDRVRLLAGTIDAIDFRDFDAFYLYNPFAENLYIRDARVDHEVELSRRRLERDVGLVREALARAPNGTRVVTYFGMSGRLSPDYRLVSIERGLPGALRLWVKKPPKSSSSR